MRSPSARLVTSSTTPPPGRHQRVLDGSPTPVERLGEGRQVRGVAVPSHQFESALHHVQRVAEVVAHDARELVEPLATPPEPVSRCAGARPRTRPTQQFHEHPLTRRERPVTGLLGCDAARSVKTAVGDHRRAGIAVEPGPVVGRVVDALAQFGHRFGVGRRPLQETAVPPPNRFLVPGRSRSRDWPSHSMGRRRSSLTAREYYLDGLNSNRAPPSVPSVTETVQPCAVAMSATTESPKPVPPSRDVTPCLNTSSRLSGGIPLPSSSI